LFPGLNSGQLAIGVAATQEIALARGVAGTEGD